MNSIINQKPSTEILQNFAELKNLLKRYESLTGRDPTTVLRERLELILPHKVQKADELNPKVAGEQKFKDASTSPLKDVEQFLVPP
jgi:hypothetical protein